MEALFKGELEGQDIELICLGGGRFRGTVRRVADGVVHLKWDEKTTYVVLEKIVAFWPYEESSSPAAMIGFSR